MATRVKCPGCGNASQVPPETLGRSVRCKKCETRFTLVAEPDALGEDDLIPLAGGDADALSDTSQDAIVAPVAAAPLQRRPAPAPVPSPVPAASASQPAPAPGFRPTAALIGAGVVGLLAVGGLVGYLVSGGGSSTPPANGQLAQASAPEAPAGDAANGQGGNALPGGQLMPTPLPANALTARPGGNGPAPGVPAVANRPTPPPAPPTLINTPARPQPAAVAPGLLAAKPAPAANAPAPGDAGADAGDATAKDADAKDSGDPAEPKEVSLPDRASAITLAAGGRYILLSLSGQKKIAVFDVNEKKIVKYVSVSDSTFKVAGGEDKFFVLANNGRILQRYNLDKFEKESTVQVPGDTEVAWIGMGHASSGPLWVQNRKGIFPLDPKTLKDLKLRPADERNTRARQQGSDSKCLLRVSANGRVVGAWRTESSPQGFFTASLVGNQLDLAYDHDTVGHVTPAPNGRVVYTAIGRMNVEGKPMGATDGGKGYGSRGSSYGIPAVEGSDLYVNLKLPAPGERDGQPVLSVNSAASGDRIVDLPDVDFPKEMNVFDRDPIGNDQRFLFYPNSKLFIVLGPNNDRLALYPFDLDKALDASGLDYLLITSEPPDSVSPGATYKYKPSVRSKKGGVKVKVDSGPGTMSVTPDGTISWAVPKSFKEPEVDVIANITDDSGQEVLHTFKININGVPRPAAPAAGRPTPTDPRRPPSRPNIPTRPGTRGARPPQ